ncbi:FG-GAP repeat domain-containing protein [Methanosarcina sp. T3]|uniref:FG-GAP repeat domain-containing protein n=1 Tax=Methanosarcina sp. T3 TaxID=3439062 RepID=UPI003F871E4B
MDITGDGLVDILKGYFGSSGYVHDAWINTGDGWEQDNSWNPPALIASYTTNQGVQFADLNGDGLADIVHAEARLQRCQPVK